MVFVILKNIIFLCIYMWNKANKA